MLIGDDGLINTTNPLNAAYLEEHQLAAAQGATILPREHRRGVKVGPEEGEDGAGGGSQGGGRKASKTRRRAAEKPAPPAPRITRGPPAGSSEAQPPRKPAATPADARRLREEMRAGGRDGGEGPAGADDDSADGEPDTPGLDVLSLAGAEALTLKAEKDKADIALKRAQTRIHDMRLLEKKNILIPRDLVRQDYAALDAALKTNFRDLPRRISAQLTALAVAEGARAVEAYLEREVSAALARANGVAEERGMV